MRRYPNDLFIVVHQSLEYFSPSWMLTLLSITVYFLNHIIPVASVLPESTFWVEENVAKGTLIGRIACPNSGGCLNLKQVTYTLLAQSQIGQYFHIDPSEGYIHAAQKIDREKLCTNLDGSFIHTRLTRSVRQIKSTKKNNGHTTAESKQSTQEDSTQFHTYGNVRESQKRISRTSKNLLVHMSSNTCQIRFQVHISLTHADGTLENHLQDVHIVITDLNDNIPEFFSPSFTLSVLESSPIDAEFRLPQAIDADAGTHGITTYRMTRALQTAAQVLDKKMCTSFQPELTQNPDPEKKPIEDNDLGDPSQLEIYSPFAGDFFVLKLEADFNGLLQPLLKQTRQLDREQHGALYFCLIAEDGGGNEGVLPIRIDLLDVNDNIPQWQGLPYRVFISECDQQASPGVFPNSGIKLLFNLYAEDKDVGRNGMITYRLAQQEPMTHHSVTTRPKLPTIAIKENQVFLASKLDYEALNKFWIPVEAVDAGGLSNFTEIEVNVEDCNDHAPIIEVFSLTKESERNATQSGVYDHKMRDGVLLWVTEEDQARAQLATLMVHDLDQHGFAQITCHLESRTPPNSHADYVNYFKLQPITSFPDTEAVARVSTGTQGRSLPSVFTLYKRESMAIDREKVNFITLTVVCSDNGVPQSHETRKTVYVKIKDINDNPPVVGGIDSSHLAGAPFVTQTIHVLENQPFGTLVGTVSATDADEGINAQLLYTFLSQSELTNASLSKEDMLLNGQGLFELEPTTGNLFTHVPLDREMNSSFSTYVRVSDQGSPPLSSTVLLHILVKDVNDSPPHFVSSAGTNGRIIFVVNESIGKSRVHGRLIGQLSASDADEGPNANVHYELVEDSLVPKGLAVVYRVTTKGKIYADGVMDREQSREHQFTVRAVDGAPKGQQLSASAVVIVQLKDINDSPPHFLSPRPKQDGSIASDLINITVNVLPGTVLYRIHVTDLDESENTQLRFVLRSAKFLSNFFALRSYPSPVSESNEATEASTELILVNPLSQLPSMRTFVQEASDLTTRSSSLAPKEYFLYIIVKDSDREPSHSSTARLQLHIYPENYSPNRLGRAQTITMKNTSEFANVLPGKIVYNTETHSVMADNIRETDRNGGRNNKTYGLTAILVIAIASVCIFLGLFCFVAFLYLRGPSVRQQENEDQLPNVTSKVVQMHGRNAEDNGSTSDHTLYLDLFRQRDTNQDRVGDPLPLKYGLVNSRNDSCHRSECAYLLTTPAVPPSGENYNGLSIQLRPVAANNSRFHDGDRKETPGSQTWTMVQPSLN
ncbi:Protocadherin beta-4, partial [Clonorchis sinensis]